MATTAVAPSAAAASGDADSGMSKYYASKIGELSAVSCVRAKGLRRMLIGMFCASLLGLRRASNFWLWRYPSVCGGIGPVRAPRTVYYRDSYVGRENVCLFSACGGGCVVVVYQPHDTNKTCACLFILFTCISLGVVCDIFLSKHSLCIVPLHPPATAPPNRLYKRELLISSGSRPGGMS